ncbi:hypothetical protein BSL78_01399 [Apostichopus japonicus]|uniref:BROMI N-terminal domain-containing protein n=1 Tax=Stichopus japonicus TaxID=307972 RepID=A0A2G8LN79_STIJA|nr:hypothetical protein BSL78_01399 [Apostichopus japonicus]
MAHAVGPEEDLLPSIRQLITSVSPSLQAAGTLAAAEDVLFHLEETDENFHRYEFVKYVKNKIEEVLGPLIEEKLENRDFNEHSKDPEMP